MRELQLSVSWQAGRVGSGPTRAGRVGLRRRRSEKRWLDLDALDTSWMDQNVHAMRHNYFTLNPQVINPNPNPNPNPNNYFTLNPQVTLTNPHTNAPCATAVLHLDDDDVT